ncbi:unnamed protein product, partial [Sphenostylis stenocarpa]
PIFLLIKKHENQLEKLETAVPRVRRPSQTANFKWDARLWAKFSSETVVPLLSWLSQRKIFK